MKIVADTCIPFLKGVFEPYAEVTYLDGSEFRHDSVADADALMIRTRTRCDSRLLEDTGVRIIATATIGTDHIDVPWCESHGIKVMNSAGCNSQGVADYVLSALYLLAARKSIRLDGATFGIVGAGHVGSKVARMAGILGFNVLVNDPPRAEKEGNEGFVPLDYLLENSDIVTLHIPLDDTTRGMAGEAFFSKMKEGAFFINAARGEVVDEVALLHAIPKLGPVIIDTWANEPEINRTLLDAVDIATPHVAGYSYQGKMNGTGMAVRAIARFFGIEPLYGYQPEVEDPRLKAITLNTRGMSQGEIAALFQYNYPVLTEDFMLRLDPSTFEKIRSEYAYRREFDIR